MEQDPYPLPSNVHVSGSVTVKLNEGNYLLWKPQLEALLFSQKLLGFVNGQELQPAATMNAQQGDVIIQVANPRHTAWEYTDQLIKSWLYSTLSEEVLGCVVGFRTSREIWVYLADNFNRRSIGRIFELRRNLQLLTKKGRSYSEYCREFRRICDQLSSIGEPVEETMKIFTFLNGLGREYDAINTVIQNSLTRVPIPTFSEVISEVGGFDARLQAYEDTPPVSPHLAFQTSGGYQRGRGRFNRGRFGFSSRGRGFSQQVGSGSSSEYNERPTCQICGRYGHSAYKCYNRFDQNYQSSESPQALAALQTSDFSGREWYPDSGASAHITPVTTGLQNVTTFNGPETVVVADGKNLPITHVGSTSIASSSGNIPLNDILVCPSISQSLLSISKLCEDYPCAVYFDDDKVLVLDKNSLEVLTRGSRRNGIYVLDNLNFLALYSTRQQATSHKLWHYRLGHANDQVIQHLIKSKFISVNKSDLASICEPCQMAKSSKLPFSVSDSTSLSPLELIHCDLWGPSSVTSVQGFKYYAIFIDDYSRFSWFYPLKLKSDFYDIFVKFQAQVENEFSVKIKGFQSDGGGEFTNTKFLHHLAKCGIRHQLSCPHTPQQNGLAERKHRHLVELGLSMLFHSQVPLTYWVEVFFTASQIINLLPTNVLDMLSPFEVLKRQKPSYSHLRVFGCGVYPCLRPYTDHKLEPRSLLCVFLGYNQKYKGYRCLYPPTGRVFITRHAIFDETIFPFKDRYKEFRPEYKSAILKTWQSSLLPIPQPVIRQSPAPLTFFRPLEKPTIITEPAVTPASSPAISEHSSTSDSSSESSSSDSSDSDSSGSVNNNHSMITRGKAGIRKPNPRYIMLTNVQIPAEPNTIEEALKDPGWVAACEEELHSLYVTDTYDLIPYSPDLKVIDSRWVFTNKLDANGRLDRLRARLVAKGFQQSEGIDFLETFSPVVRSSTIRTVLNVAVSKQWRITQLDVKNAFLHGDLSEPVFMTQPPGFVDPAKPSHICKLKKAIYGLKQAPRAWFDKFSNFLLDMGFSCSKADPSLFTYHHNGQSVALLLYVDDIILTGSDSVMLDSFINTLSTQFMMKDLGSLHYFLGIQVIFTSTGLFLHQGKYAEEILHMSAMSTCNPVHTPIPVREDETIDGGGLFSDPTYFRRIAGKLQYLTLTRPDLQYGVNLVCQRMHSPTNTDFTLLKRVLRYLRGTHDYGLHLTQASSLHLQAFSDSDWAGCKETRRSTTGFCTYLGPNLISWCSKRQPTVSRSSTEAEYRAMAATAAEVKWMSFILRDLQITQLKPTTLHCDNLSAVYLTTNPALHNRTKHMDIDYHFVREQVALGSLITQHVSASEQLADIMTKPLSRRSFEDLRRKLGVGSLPTSSLRGDVSPTTIQAHQH